MVETQSSKKMVTKKDQNHRKIYSRFLIKALILAVFCAVVPVFLSQTPELSNQTRLLELLHLVLVGIAVSYGLFSRRNYDGGGGNNDHKPDHKILEVSHESESEPSDDSSGDHRKFQTWRNKYQMKIPDVIREKPLLLPVRSLNYSRVFDSGDQWEKVRSKRELLKTLVDENKDDVLPSPIPWRSRSTEIESQSSNKNLATVEIKPLIKTRANLTPSSPPPPPPPPPPLPAYYNSASRNGVYRSNRRESAQKTKFGSGEFHPPPPPPPPPPPADYYKSPPMKLRRKSSEQKTKLDGKRNSTKKVWWSDLVVESKEQRIIKQDTKKNDSRSFLGSKANEESEEEEHRKSRRIENETHGDDKTEEKKVEEEEEVGESNNGNDVDKKADEFIAKFREQIRLQRIESIKRSANKISANSR